MISSSVDDWFATWEEETRLGIIIDLGKDKATGLQKNDHDAIEPLVVDERYLQLKENFPKSGPYLLSHGDLNPTNIFVKDGKIEAIIDWEFAGYYPWWYERFRLWGQDYRFSPYLEKLWEDIHPEMSNRTVSWNGGEGSCQCYTYNREIRILVHPSQELRKMAETPCILRM
jgi:hypothetical protein